ncbi:MAG: Aspartate racemase [uncultured Truepera sp.]|uniref:Aspartate racemase n=1 Tax=uncultured Truepera sp. TaxID=543023 RepID=A0A6J4VNV5_9DEIN|nr:MAG: Aspartate racemase [uncultured Truepera sp.]
MGLTKPLTVGVLGGLGPEATLDFYTKVLSLTLATRDQDHLHMIIDSNPQVPNRNEAVAGTGPSPGPMLAEMAAGLEKAGADFLVMVCNAAHAFQGEIEAAVSIPFVSIIEETCEATLQAVPRLKKVGVLGSSGCLDAGLYQTAFAERGVEVLVPTDTDRDLFMTLLYRIKAGDKGTDVRGSMRALAESLLGSGAQAIVAGCTEVPLVLGGDDLRCPLIDATAVLAERTVHYALNGLQTPINP